MSLGERARRAGVYDRIEPFYSRAQRVAWHAKGRPLPAPSAVKRQILRDFAREYGLRVLVETGTYRGDTVRALRHEFAAIHSIEIDAELYRAVRRRARSQVNAHLHLGDSADVIGRIVASLQEPALFWLDAHFSGGTTGGSDGQPVAVEVAAVVESRFEHVILIDDVREFGVDPSYPSLEDIRAFATTRGYRYTAETDIARLVPAVSIP